MARAARNGRLRPVVDCGYPQSFRSKISPTNCGLAFPWESLITCPFRKFSDAALPALKSAAGFGFEKQKGAREQKGASPFFLHFARCDQAKAISRKIRAEFEGATYHVMCRGDRRKDITENLCECHSSLFRLRCCLLHFTRRLIFSVRFPASSLGE